MLPCQNDADHAGVPADPVSTPSHADASRASDGSAVQTVAGGVESRIVSLERRLDELDSWRSKFKPQTLVCGFEPGEITAFSVGPAIPEAAEVREPE